MPPTVAAIAGGSADRPVVRAGVRRHRRRSAGRSAAHGGRAAGPDAAVAARPLDDLGDRGEAAHEVRGPAGHELGAGRGRASSPSAVDGSPVERRCRRPRPRASSGRRETATPGRPCSRAKCGRPLVAVAADDPRVVGLDPVDQRRDRAPARGLASWPSSRGSGRTGAGTPTSPPCARTAAIVSAAGQPGRDGLARGTGRSGRRRRS